VGSDWGLPKLVGIECIDCHVGRQAIELHSLKVWATALLSQVSELQKHTLITHYFTAWVMCLGTINGIYYSEQLYHYQFLTGIFTGMSQSGIYMLIRMKDTKNIKKRVHQEAISAINHHVHDYGVSGSVSSS